MPERDEERDRNLQAVARHLQQQRAQAPKDRGPSRVTAALKKWGPLGAIILFALGKAKWLLAALKFAKVGSFISMLVSVWVYALVFGWAFAVGFVLLIFVHEYGHLLAMKRQGIPAGAPVFIPFLGAAIAMKGLPRNAWVEAVVGIGGPLVGTAGAAVCLLVALVTDSLFVYALASVGFLINLFNMIPISPLDGGRIVGAISRWFWVVGYGVGIAVFLMTHSPILFLVLLLGLFSLPRLLRPADAYYEIPSAQRLQMAVGFFGLLVFMALGHWMAEEALAPVRQKHASLDAATLLIGVSILLEAAGQRASGWTRTGPRH